MSCLESLPTNITRPSELIWRSVRRRSGASLLLSYLAHLYHQAELLSPEETQSWMAQDKIWSYGDLKLEARSGSSNTAPPPPSPSRPFPTQRTPVESTRTKVKRKTTPRTPEAKKQTIWARMEEPDAVMEDLESLCARIITVAREIHHHIKIQESMLQTIRDLIECLTWSKLVDAVQTTLTNSNWIQEHEATERRLNREVTSLQI